MIEQIGGTLTHVSRTRCSAKRCTADPGPPEARCVTVPGLQRIIPLRFMLRCARDTRTESRPEQPRVLGLVPHAGEIGAEAPGADLVEAGGERARGGRAHH